MTVKLVADCSANICKKITLPISYVPLKIVTNEKEYVDNEALDVPEMLRELKAYKGTSGTACPGVQDWLTAFEGADTVFAVAITSGLSGSYNAGMVAVNEFKESHPDAQVFLLDSLSAGPELELILEKYEELVSAGLDFDGVVSGIREYTHHSHILFSLASVDNFVKNGRINPLLGKAIGLLGLRILCKGSDEGTIQPVHKSRGEKKALEQLFASLKDAGYKGGKVRIAHTLNEAGAAALQTMILSEFPNADVSVNINRGLCAFYSETGGILVGFEDL